MRGEKELKAKTLDTHSLTHQAFVVPPLTKSKKKTARQSEKDEKKVFLPRPGFEPGSVG